MKLRWSKRARTSLKDIIKYISKDYPLTAAKVRLHIFDTAESILPNPEKFAIEETLRDDGNIRFKSVWSYKVVYLVMKNQVVILDVFDSRQDPEKIRDLLEE
jgi:plasmid stabilization system protein ParE